MGSGPRLRDPPRCGYQRGEGGAATCVWGPELKGGGLWNAGGNWSDIEGPTWVWVPERRRRGCHMCVASEARKLRHVCMYWSEVQGHTLVWGPRSITEGMSHVCGDRKLKGDVSSHVGTGHTERRTTFTMKNTHRTQDYIYNRKKQKKEQKNNNNLKKKEKRKKNNKKHLPLFVGSWYRPPP